MPYCKFSHAKSSYDLWSECYETIQSRVLSRGKSEGMTCSGNKYSFTDTLWEIVSKALDIDRISRTTADGVFIRQELYDYYCESSEGESIIEFVIIKHAQIPHVLKRLQALNERYPDFEERFMQSAVTETVSYEMESIESNLHARIPRDLQHAILSGALSPRPMSLEDRLDRIEDAIELVHQAKEKEAAPAGAVSAYDDEGYNSYDEDDMEPSYSFDMVVSKLEMLFDWIDSYLERQSQGHSYWQKLSDYLVTFMTQAKEGSDDGLVVYHNTI
mmetsp:Transcript_12335/g.16949  ORF Transcript_12335/g.16949 Transcript_12335/m.16949 type:complete len:273 (-) Transcript_12335:223-1041(-)